jgi:hypothetical protein
VPITGHETEEHEDEDLAETEVAIRMLAAGVEPGGCDAGQAHQEEPPLLSEQHESESGEHGHRKAEEGSALDLAGWCKALAD